jgi:hypothetical protein
MADHQMNRVRLSQIIRGRDDEGELYVAVSYVALMAASEVVLAIVNRVETCVFGSETWSAETGAVARSQMSVLAVDIDTEDHEEGFDDLLRIVRAVHLFHDVAVDDDEDEDYLDGLEDEDLEEFEDEE